MFLRDPSINFYSREVPRLVRFYQTLGFRETFRTREVDAPGHVEVTLDRFTTGISSVDAAIADHGLRPNLQGHSIELVLETGDTD